MMKLTPIRVPGKRRPKGQPPIVFDVAPRKKRLRRTTSKSQAKVATPTSRVSYLERDLPLEIVERIFWMSENVSFARSGLRLGCLLSGVSTRRETFLRAFAPTWDVWFGCVKGSDVTTQSYHDWQTDSSRFGGNPEFQSALLQYSWVDISFILESMDFWARKDARNRFFQHHKLWGDPDSSNRLDDDPGGINNFKSARAYFQHDYDAFSAKAGEEQPLLLSDDASWIEVHRETQIPDHLLTGPWDDEATQKLFWLVRAGARLSADQTWETTLEGYHNAMAVKTESPTAEISLPIIRLLLILGGNHWPEYIATSEFERLHTLERSLRFGNRPDAYQKYASVAAMLARNYLPSHQNHEAVESV